MKTSGTRESTKGSRMHSPRLLSIKEAAEYLGLKVYALRKLVQDGELPVVRFTKGKTPNRKMYVDLHDLEEMIENGKEYLQ